MKAIAIDDEPIALDIIRSHASRVPYLDLKAVFTDAFEAMDYLQKDSIDLIFLDIKMPDISGLDFFNSLSQKPLVIFTTAYAEHAVTSFELDAIDYLLKPFSFARFLKGCNKAYELYKFRNAAPVDFLFVKTGYEQVRVLYEEILYLEASGNYVSFVLKDKTVLSRSTFAEIASLMPADKFVRIHRSFIVALNKIDKAEKSQVTVNGVKIPIGEAYGQGLREALGR
jgi:two-component system, LytTR family, response regulator